MRIRFEDGEPQAIEPFVTGFLVDEGGEVGQFARLAGLAVAPDGALLVSDDQNGVIYRISYADGAEEAAPDAAIAPPSAAASGEIGAASDGPQELAMAVVDAEADEALEVTSEAFAENQSIPVTYSEYGEGISPPLDWSGSPEEIRSFVLMLEDPDALDPKPFVHWIVYNLPPDVRGLREGVPGAPRLELPDGAMQGRNSYGSTGYFGMKPPAGPEHRYHFPVFALDTMLELPAGADRQAVLDAIGGHVLAKGDLVGLFQKP